MITAGLNRPEFEYDIHSLVKAFYPEQEVLVKALPREALPESEYHIDVFYGEDQTVFSLLRGTQRELCANRAGGENAADGAEHEFPEGSESVPHSMAECPGPVREPEASGSESDELLAQEIVSVSLMADRSTRVSELKRGLYRLLSRFSGRTLPWGTLTGIRPTKMPLEMLLAGKTDGEIAAFMRESYYTSDEKIALSTEVAHNELELLSRIDYGDGCSLYIGIPFCPSTCLYCSFTSYPIGQWRKRIDEYLDCLCREIDFAAERCAGKYVNTVYIGGGTPTSLEPEQLERLLTRIGERFHLFDASGRFVYGGENHLLEVTVEAGRPDSITEEKLRVLYAHNVSRISINPQTMKEETLRLIGRNHTVEQTRERFRLARSIGFDNINMDLIVGLPEESYEDVCRTMDAIANLAPDNVTVHSLAVKRAARLRMQREDYGHLHIENTWETIRMTAQRCRAMGMSPYYLYRQKNMAGNFENVGYAAPGKAGVYNILMMEDRQTIFALGAGAITKVIPKEGNRIERAANVKDIKNYLERIDEMIERKRILLDKEGF